MKKNTGTLVIIKNGTQPPTAQKIMGAMHRPTVHPMHCKRGMEARSLSLDISTEMTKGVWNKGKADRFPIKEQIAKRMKIPLDTRSPRRPINKVIIAAYMMGRRPYLEECNQVKRFWKSRNLFTCLPVGRRWFLEFLLFFQRLGNWGPSCLPGTPSSPG